MQLTAKELARVVNGTIEGDENVKVWKPCKIEEGCEGGITFLGNPKYTHYIYEQQASIVIVRKDFVPEHPVNSTLIRVDNPYIAVALLLHTFNERTKPPKGRSWRSHVGRGSKIGKHCYMGPYAVVGRHTMIGNDVKIYPNACIGDNCKIGDGTIIYAGVKIYEGVEIGRNCIIHAGAVIGSDGFGFAPAGDGTWNKIDQIGNVVLTAMASQVGIAGSCKVGEECIIAGQAGLVGHITIGDHVTIGAQSGVTRNVPDKATIFGSPATDAVRRRKIEVLLRNLDKIVERIDKLGR